MLRNEYLVIGVMSGTSLDGVDLCCVRFSLNGRWRFDILYATTIAYPDEWSARLSNLTNCSIEELAEIDRQYTNYLGTVINEFITSFNISHVDFISSHGHTALHQPEKGLTYQKGNLPQIAEIVKHTVVCDFRSQDVALGGQGAPLVPIGDKLLFSEFEYCINLGGFSNISFDFNGERIAFDICPVNTVLNYYAKILGFAFDENGNLSKRGKINLSLLNQLNNIEYYGRPFPKSLGVEYVNQLVLPLIGSIEGNPVNVLRTFTEHIAIHIAKQIDGIASSKVLISGGGAKNTFLVERLRYYTLNKVVIPSTLIIDFKEAVIFAFLGVLRFRNEVNCLKSVTGAKQDHSSGKIYFLKLH